MHQSIFALFKIKLINNSGMQPPAPLFESSIYVTRGHYAPLQVSSSNLQTARVGGIELRVLFFLRSTMSVVGTRGTWETFCRRKSRLFFLRSPWMAHCCWPVPGFRCVACICFRTSNPPCQLYFSLGWFLFIPN
jgi:hypothetical protein